ncbi:presqualene diphosphate synthase HpnD [Thiohalophilus thiocyanatoxydans]|uniref:Farnesyl-diphosphate farnesyltransferase n=1 Tax=Thiohalophilus thiocyanatoxydans TaxID=381308 RepID=A0A4R8IXW2_9GAMM|nr:presqualene diphosphate synthase HpnD [Thiohalophilus thiocyanatoxydans]TDY02639.1 farnesyl-diphosphate farnesyltransferase [Thiohalophilus thiocyanatoxydans]
MTPEQYCQEKTATSGSSFYYSFLFLPRHRRRAITALYAFCREVDDVVDADSMPEIRRVKLQWWRSEIERLYSGQPQHPVTRALQAAVRDFDLPQEYFLEIIDGMEMDLDQQRYDTFKELSLYCYRVASVVGLLSAEIFGYRDRRTLKYARDLGMAFQLTNILRDVGEDARRGRIYLPREDLQQFGVSEDDLLQGRESPDFYQLMAFEARRARDYYQRAHDHLPAIDRRAQRAGLVMSAIYEGLLDELEKDGFHVLTQRLSLTALAKLWLAGKTVWRETWRRRQPPVADTD